MVAKRGPGRRVLAAWPLIMVLVITVAGTVILATLPLWISLDVGVQPHSKITRLIYPTFGNPAIVKRGSEFTVEFDPRDQEFELPFVETSSFKVSVKTSHGKYPYTEEMPVRSSQVGYSSEWPEYGRSENQDTRIYLLTVTVPRNLPHDLYDLTAEAVIGDEKVTDTQPHAFKAIDEYKDDFSFVQLTDIHVWGPEINYPSCVYHERSGRPNGIDPNRKGAVYYQKVIEEINLLNPDFCIFSGDYMFGQRYFTQDNGKPWGETTEYEYEMLWFYEETLKLDVPVFLTMGNHDSYNEADEAAEEDWYVNWRELFGPIYHSYDYGDYHFVSCNSQDWSPEQRVLYDWDGIILQPAKYKGQFMGGGDRVATGITGQQLDAINVNDFTDQLAWIRDDLESHQDSKMRVLVMHHDPYKKDGSGVMWGAASNSGLKGEVKYAMGKVLDMGDGQGRVAIMKLMQDYRVSMEISGHDHSDYVATREQAREQLGPQFVDVFTWKDGGGEVAYVNTTSTQFQVDNDSRRYPGFRLIRVSDGKVMSFNYKDPKWSYPIYQGTNVGGITNLGRLVNPSVASSLDPGTGDAESVEFTISNSLDVPISRAYEEVVMPYLSGGYHYVVDNGSFGEVYVDSEEAPARIVCQVFCDVPPGGSQTVTVRKSPTADTTPPGGSVKINGGTDTTGSLQVNLDLEAVDGDGSGVCEMMISNSSDFGGASWEPYRQVVSWKLEDGTAGARTVYVKFRDGAMPPNEAAVAEDTISYVPAR